MAENARFQEYSREKEEEAEIEGRKGQKSDSNTPEHRNTSYIFHNVQYRLRL